LFKFSFNSLLF